MTGSNLLSLLLHILRETGQRMITQTFVDQTIQKQTNILL